LSYVDTSAIVAALDPLDPRQRLVKELLEKEPYKVISELVIAELASVITRREELVDNIASTLGLRREEAFMAVLLYILKKFNLKYKSIRNSTRMPLIGNMYKPLAVAIELSHKLKLRTLDLLHTAYVKIMKDEGESIQKLITVDRDFEKARKVFREIGINLHIV